MRTPRLLTAALVGGMLALAPAPASADIFVSPFLGLKFKGSTNDLDFGNGARDTKASVGVAGILVSDHGLGAELELGYNPRFFDGGDLSARSGVTTLFGNVMVAAPIRLTRESLRPYGVVGLGWMHASAAEIVGIFPVSNDFLGLALGVGAIGFVSDTTGLRFDLRYLKSVSSADQSALAGQGSARINFWRATIGLVFR